MTTMSEYPMAERCRANAARFARRLQAIHEAQGCRTWEALHVPLPQRRRRPPSGGWGCREHHIFTTTEEA